MLCWRLQRIFMIVLTVWCTNERRLHKLYMLHKLRNALDATSCKQTGYYYDVLQCFRGPAASAQAQSRCFADGGPLAGLDLPAMI